MNFLELGLYFYTCGRDAVEKQCRNTPAAAAGEGNGASSFVYRNGVQGSGARHQQDLYTYGLPIQKLVLKNCQEKW